MAHLEVLPPRKDSDSKSEGQSENRARSKGVSETWEPAIYPHQFATLKGIVLITPEGFCCVNKAPCYMDLIQTEEHTLTKDAPERSRGFVASKPLLQHIPSFEFPENP